MTSSRSAGIFLGRGGGTLTSPMFPPFAVVKRHSCLPSGLKGRLSQSGTEQLAHGGR